MATTQRVLFDNCLASVYVHIMTACHVWCNLQQELLYYLLHTRFVWHLGGTPKQIRVCPADIATMRSLYDTAHDMAYRLVSERAANMTLGSAATAQTATKQEISSISAVPVSPVPVQVNACQS